MRLAFTMMYVDDVPKTADVWVKGLGLELVYLHDDEVYAELRAGEATLAFARVEFGRSHFPNGQLDDYFERPVGRTEIGFETDRIHEVFSCAQSAGFEVVTPPTERPWGQWIGFMRDPNGILVELSTPMSEE